MQPVIIDKAGSPRFQDNAVVRKLLDEARERGFGLNELFQFDFPQSDVDQFYQMIGYSVGGYCELELVSNRSCNAAIAKAKELGFPWQQGSEAVDKWKKENGYPTD
jgi:hypothetical protein